jgi:hypothetical protein
VAPPRRRAAARARRGRRPADTARVGLLEALDEDTCLLRTGAETLETLAVHLGMLGADFEVSGPPELLDQLRTLAGRYQRATP